MKTTLLSSYSNFGKFVVKESYPNIKSIDLKQHYSHERPFSSCKFDFSGSKIYLLDSAGNLISLSLIDSSFSTLKNQQV